MKDELISVDAFQQATHLERFTFAANALMSIAGINKLNHLYSCANKDSKFDFIESVFDQLELNYQIDESQLNRIPKSGPFITISNHPFGAVDGLLLIYLISKVRPDFKVLGNFLLENIGPIKSSIISVNPFETKQSKKSSLGGIKESLKHLEQGHPLGIFPAGEVSSFQASSKTITDKRWKKSALKLIKKAEVPIIPIYFKGNNSILFNLLGMIHPSLRTIALPSELFRKKQQEVVVRIGRKIKVTDQSGWDSIDQFGRFLRAKTYSLDSSIEVKSFFKEKLYRLKSKEAIVSQEDQQLICNEIELIQDCKILQQAEFELYFCASDRIPVLLNEIGRLREITFREIGEGSNKSIDIDEYDLHYHHLFLWDKTSQKVVGAYRTGLGQEIMNGFGKKGFYISSLFKLKKEFNPILDQSIEMGRSFVIKEYQQKRLPLFLLWKGILKILNTNTKYRYLIGPVSISGKYTKLSQMLIVSFIKRFYFDEELAKSVKPRKSFKVKFKKVEGDKLIENSKSDIKKIDQIIADCEPNHMPIPVLIKKYLKQNAKIIGFNIDPKFNSALDGLIILDLKDLPDDTKKDFGDEIKSKTLD